MKNTVILELIEFIGKEIAPPKNLMNPILIFQMNNSQMNVVH